MTPSQERQLVRRASAGDETAIEALIRAHQEPLHAFLPRRAGRPATAEDVVQEAFVRVLRNLDHFDSRFRFSTWLFTIAKRLYLNAVQKLAPCFDGQAILARESPRPGPAAESQRGEMMRNVRGLLDTVLAGLPGVQREIILLFHQQSWPITDIARYMRMPEGTVKSHLHRGRRRMRRLILESRTMSRRAEEVWS
jgi:RNA polymerase sigma-70 factor (ECF subfamily)